MPVHQHNIHNSSAFYVYSVVTLNFRSHICYVRRCLQVFPHEYRRAMQEAAAVKKAEEEQKAAIKAAGDI
jgi:hypothetical protein